MTHSEPNDAAQGQNFERALGEVAPDLLEACRAALLLAGDGDLPDNGEYSGAAITDQIRAAVAKAEGADPGTAGRGDVVTDLLRACKVVSLDRRIRAWLAENDPKALAQVEAAIRKAEGGEP